MVDAVVETYGIDMVQRAIAINSDKLKNEFLPLQSEKPSATMGLSTAYPMTASPHHPNAVVDHSVTKKELETLMEDDSDPAGESELSQDVGITDPRYYFKMVSCFVYSCRVVATFSADNRFFPSFDCF